MSPRSCWRVWENIGWGRGSMEETLIRCCLGMKRKGGILGNGAKCRGL